MSGVARNQPCPCGSGKKYKKCCGRPGVGEVPRTGRLPRGSYYRFLLSLTDSEPLIWRRFLLRADLSFEDLHEAIQVLGWTHSHLWHFVDPRERRILAGVPMDQTPFREPVPDAARVPLAAFFTQVGDRCAYEYDFGDGWLHEIVLEEIVSYEGEEFERMLLGGAESFPLEDCGGIPGHQRLLTFWATGEDPWGDAEVLRECGWDVPPEPFDLSRHKDWFHRGASQGQAPRVLQEPQPRVETDSHCEHGATAGGSRVGGQTNARRIMSLVERLSTGQSLRVLDDQVIDRVEEILEEAMGRIQTELGLLARMQSHRCSQFSSTCKLEIATVQADGLITDRHADTFLRRCGEFGLEMGDLGRPFVVNKKTWRIVGLRPRAKNPVLCESLDAPHDDLAAWKVEDLLPYLR